MRHCPYAMFAWLASPLGPPPRGEASRSIKDRVLSLASPDSSHVGPIVEDAKALVAGISGALLTHVRRQASEVALAHRSWFEEPPDLIVVLLYEEYNR
ncbi:hypothetical protein D8674_006438 [Pyrus ussuriensis x Pyrus communis]|uniref:Uncharacterized protein n=1 Tax=Pyrus ussuriensis x Pyrus communis TaxID=2448454 RepID=A0A5N5FYS8_9ROSA|nr:hypothetical protein D8674_006438 [Pyrus ussuriensis x Pyrus communis]